MSPYQGLWSLEKVFSGWWLIGILQALSFPCQHLFLERWFINNICWEYPLVSSIFPEWKKLLDIILPWRDQLEKQHECNISWAKSFARGGGEMGTDDGNFLSQSFLPWDKKHIHVSQEETCQWLKPKTPFFFLHCNSPCIWLYSAPGIPTHTAFWGPLHFTGEELRQALRGQDQSTLPFS